LYPAVPLIAIVEMRKEEGKLCEGAERYKLKGWAERREVG
jgi:hypothetical protein